MVADGSHLHLWHLSDGTGLHAPYGELVVEDGTGQLCCHFCGRWFVSLGAHVRVHGTTAERYREDLGLCRGDPLTASSLSTTIAARQKLAYGRSREVRERFAVGQQLARDGVLGKMTASRRVMTPDPPGAIARQRQALEDGRVTMASRRQTSRDALIKESGAPDLATYLRARYAQGANLGQLADENGSRPVPASTSHG